MTAGDAGDTDASTDRALGPISSLRFQVANQNAMNQVGVRSLDGILVSMEAVAGDDLTAFNPRNRRHPVARDAFSRYRLWQREDLTVVNRLCFLLTGSGANARVVVHAAGVKHLQAVSLADGRDVLTYDQGPDLGEFVYRDTDYGRGSARFWP